MKASEEADQAFQAFQKADQDMANSRLQIEKVRDMMFFSRNLFIATVKKFCNIKSAKLPVKSLIFFFQLIKIKWVGYKSEECMISSYALCSSVAFTKIFSQRIKTEKFSQNC